MAAEHSGGVPEDCPCCNNPWRRTPSSGAPPETTTLLFCAACTTAEEAKIQPVAGLNRANLDWSVDLSDNFYKWANGGWIRQNPIPPEYPSWNTFVALHVQSQQQCRDLLQELLDGADEGSSEAKKVALFYQAAMDEDKIEKDGIEPLTSITSFVDTIAESYKSGDKVAYAAGLGQLAADYGIYAFFNTGVSPDAKNSDHSICQISQGGLGLPDRDYYFDEDKQDKREKYVQHVAQMLELLLGDMGTDKAAAAAKQIMELETSLAKTHMTKTENRDPMATYNKMTIAALAEKGEGAFDFQAYLRASCKLEEGASVVDKLGEVNVRNVEALKTVAKVASEIDADVLQSYLKWQVAKSCAPYLSKAWVQANFEFYEKALSGTQELKPRWKRAMAFTESALGEALGKLYCAKYFDESSKTRAVAIVESVRAALEERLKEVEWIRSESTRTVALEKMGRFKVKIGYPNEWIDYSTLVMDDCKSLIEMVFRARAFAHAREVKEMNAPTDREKWFLTPQTVNAYYHPNLNEVVFPAAILQHPFFDKNADDAVNYGSMGAVVGHEMTHGFDDKGRKFDQNGELKDWWAEDDAKEYESRVDVMVEQASKFEVHGQHVKGKLTSGENIADLGGLRLALRALRARSDFDATTKTDGFTPEQRFFMAWAQCWRQNITKERSLQLLSLDPHGPNEMRCNGPIKNMPEFHEAFNVKSDAAMYTQSAQRVDIW